MTGISAVAALAAGVLALLSPCSALLLPSFFAYAFTSRTALLARTLAFTLGLMVVLVPLGSGIRAVSSVFYGHRQLLVTVAGWLIIGFGVLLLLGKGLALPFANRIQQASSGWGRAARERAGPLGWVATVALGGVYGLAGFCSGPALGAILTVAATSSSPLAGAGLLALYAVGMALPLFLLAMLWDRFDLGRRGWLRGRMVRLGLVEVHTTSLVGGVLFIAIGVLFLAFDGTAGLFGAVGLDTTDTEYAAQEWVVDALGSVPGWVLPLAVAVVALTVWWRSGRADSDASPD